MNESLLSWYQALQLLALGPCLFMVFFLSVAGRKMSQTLVPVLYFISLSCAFFLPLRDVVGYSSHAYDVLLWLSNMQPAVCFLLIVQFMTGSIPAPRYWGILAIPLVGGSPLIYASLVTDGEICLYEKLCTQPQVFNAFYNIFSISMAFLILLFIYRRLSGASQTATAEDRHQKYALVLALIALNLALLAMDLFGIMEYADTARVQLAQTVVRMGFIYLTLTLLFRMFDRPLELAYERIPLIKPQELSAKDILLAEQIRGLFTKDKLYRDMALDRSKMARKLAVTEATLSRVVNQSFHKNVSMLINQYRVEEAKLRLAGETTAITAIAFEVGFSSIPSFNRVFRQFCDMAPSTYRNAHQTEPK